tara:strand:- start:40782 stop:41567 length:786 start_codon:yes stop_codon:yes gene_type:complete
MKNKYSARPLMLIAALLMTTTAAQARHPWVTDNPRLDKNAWFSNLESGAEVQSPFVAKFGLTGIGIASIKKPVVGTGHHHLLIDRGLPLNFTEPLPFNDQYVHFGKGQMEAILDLPTGKHCLRLVFADHRHIPNFVYSDEIVVNVTGSSGKTVDSLKREEVSLLTPRSASSISPPFAVAMHAAGYNVSHTEITEPDTGHFRLRLAPAKGDEVVIDLTGGETEVWLNPPAGSYSASLEMLSNSAPGTVMAKTAPVRFEVKPR